MRNLKLTGRIERLCYGKNRKSRLGHTVLDKCPRVGAVRIDNQFLLVQFIIPSGVKVVSDKSADRKVSDNGTVYGQIAVFVIFSRICERTDTAFDYRGLCRDTCQSADVLTSFDLVDVEIKARDCGGGHAGDKTDVIATAVRIMPGPGNVVSVLVRVTVSVRRVNKQTFDRRIGPHAVFVEEKRPFDSSGKIPYRFPVIWVLYSDTVLKYYRRDVGVLSQIDILFDQDRCIAVRLWL